jgi:hypothetical protein
LGWQSFWKIGVVDYSAFSEDYPRMKSMYDGFLEGSKDLYFNVSVNQIPGSEMHRFKPDGLPHLWYTELVIMGCQQV